MGASHFFKFTILSCVIVLILSASESKGIGSVDGNKIDSTQQIIRKSHVIHKRAFSFGDLANDLKEKAEDSANDVINSAVGDLLDDVVPKTGNDVVDSAVGGILEDAISDNVDDILNSLFDDILDDAGIDSDVIDDVKDILGDVIGSDGTSPATPTDGQTTTSGVGRRTTSTHAGGDEIVSTDKTPNGRDTRLIDFIMSPVTSFVNRLRDVSQNRSNKLFEALKLNKTTGGRFGFGQILSSRLNNDNITTMGEKMIADLNSEFEKRLEQRIEILMNDLFSVVSGFVESLSVEDLDILDRIENNRTREFLANNVYDILPVLVEIAFGKASFEDLRCVITKSVLEFQFDAIFMRPHISQFFTDVFLSITACYDDNADNDNNNDDDNNDDSNSSEEFQDDSSNITGNVNRTTERAFAQALTNLVNSQDEANLAALESIADAMAFVNPSSSLNIGNILSDLIPLLGGDGEGGDAGSNLANFLSNPSEDGISISRILESLFQSNDDDTESIDDDNNPYLNNLLSTIIQPVLRTLPLNDTQTAALANNLADRIVPLVSPRIEQASERVLTAGVSSVLKQLGFSDDQADNLTQQITDAIAVVIGSTSSGNGGGDAGGSGSSGSGSSGSGSGGGNGGGLDLANILNQLGSSGQLQGLIDGLLGQNGSLSGVIPPEVASALSLLSTAQGAYTTLMGVYSSTLIATSQRCQLELSAVGQGISALQPDALLFVDSIGKPGTGILQGNSYFVGNFDQCTELNYVTGTGDVIKGHYVKYKYVIKMPAGFPSIGGIVNFQEAGLPYIVWGVCLPRGCTHKDAVAVGQGVADGLSIGLQSTDILNDRDPSDDAGFICAMFVLGILSLFCLIGTFLDVAATSSPQKLQEPKHTSTPRPGKKQKPVILPTISEDPSTMRSLTGEKMVNQPSYRDLRIQIGTAQQPEVSNPTGIVDTSPQGVNKTGAIWRFFIAFSLPRNAEQILKAKHAPGEITCLHGVRVISISWVILGHAYFFGPAYGNLTALLSMSKWWTFNAIRNAPYTVDTFFVLSGCLVAYLFLKTTKKAGGLKPIHMFYFYFHRYLRLTPLLGLAILFYASVTPYLEYGPFQREIYDREEGCREKWWWNILYINNLFDTSQFCIGWSWYLPNDMQFYAIAPLIIVPLSFGYNFIGLLVALLQVSLHIIMYAYLEEKYDATLTTNTSDYFIKIYIKPYTRCGPYAIGLVLGYAIFKTKFKAKMNKFVVFLGWILAIGGGLTLVFITHDNYKDFGIVAPKWTTDASNAYEILARPLWAVCLAWMIFACSSGYGGVINSILSWRAWIPLSRLTYGVYLFHVMVIHYFNNNRRALAYFTKEFVIERYLATFILSYGLAFVASLLVETPVRNLTKPSSSGKPTNPKPVSETANTDNNNRQHTASPTAAAAALSNGSGVAAMPNGGKMMSKNVTFQEEPPRFGSNPYSSAIAMSKSASSTNNSPTPTIPSAPMMMQQVDEGSNNTSASQQQTFQETPARALPDTPSAATTATTTAVEEASPEEVRVDLTDRTTANSARNDENDRASGGKSESESKVKSVGYPNLAYVTENDGSDWLSAALADGNNAMTSSGAREMTAL